MQAVVLVGGEGRRLRPLTDTRPKPMMSLVDRPFVAHQLDHLRRHGVTDIVFSCGYRPDALRNFFGDGSSYGVRLSYVVDPAPLGTAGAIANVGELLSGDDLLVLNGDILTDLDLGALMRGHVESGAVGTIALTPVEDPSAYGLVRLTPSRAVEAFLEKPSLDQLIPGEPYLINAGTYLLSPSVVAMIPTGKQCSIEREIFPAVAADGALYGHPSDAYWRDIGTPASYLDAHIDVLAGRVHTETGGITDGRYVAPGAVVDAAATLGASVSVGAEATIAAGASITRAVIGAGTHVGQSSVIHDSIIGEGVVIGHSARVEAGMVIGDGAQIAPDSVLTGPGSVPTGAGISGV
jgi:mannose-1-phosphate guanylyltransferase